MSELSVREYLRVSRDRSGEGKSPDQQHDDNLRSIAQNGWALHPLPPYRDDDRSASRFATKTREDFGRLNFVDADWPLFGGSFTVRGVDVCWPKRLAKRLSALEGTVDVAAVAEAIAAHFPPA